MQNPPTIAEELDRKAIETLQTVMHDLAVCKITVKDAHMVLATLWSTVAGLIPKDTMDLIAQAQNHVGSQLDPGEWPHKTVVFANFGKVYVVQRHNDKVTVRGLTGQRELPAPADAVHPGMWAVDKFNEACTAIQGMGAQRII
jgi:hypothetical protein